MQKCGPKIAELRVRAVKVPMNHPHQTASGTITESPLVLIDVLTHDGIVGHSIVFTFTSSALKPTAELVTSFAPLLQNQVLAPTELTDSLLRRYRLLGCQGLVAMAIAGTDMALWDAMSRSVNMSLYVCWGASNEASQPMELWATTARWSVLEKRSVGQNAASERSRQRLATPPLSRTWK